MSSPLAQSAARDFLDATVRRWGTNEDDVYSILQQIYVNGSQPDFEAELKSQMGDGASSYVGAKNVVEAIIDDEMWIEADNHKAKDIYTQGRDTHSASTLSHLGSGYSSTFDLSSTEAKVIFAGITAACFIPTVGPVLAKGLLWSFTGYGVATAIKNGAEMYVTRGDNDAFKENARDMGSALGMATPGAGFLLVKRIPPVARFGRWAADLFEKAPKPPVAPSTTVPPSTTTGPTTTPASSPAASPPPLALPSATTSQLQINIPTEVISRPTLDSASSITGARSQLPPMPAPVGGAKMILGAPRPSSPPTSPPVYPLEMGTASSEDVILISEPVTSLRQARGLRRARFDKIKEQLRWRFFQ